MAKKKRLKAKIGDVFTVRVADKGHVRGQVVAVYEIHILLVAIFPKLLDEATLLSSPFDPNLQPLFLASVFSERIESGTWPIVSNFDPILNTSSLPKYRVEISGEEFVESYDGRQCRPAVENEAARLRNRSFYTPQVLENAIFDHFGALDAEMYKVDELVRMRREFIHFDPVAFLQGSEVVL
jgi:hypothetical protein